MDREHLYLASPKTADRRTDRRDEKNSVAGTKNNPETETTRAAAAVVWADRQVVLF